MLTDTKNKDRKITKHRKPREWYSDSQKVEAVKLWLMTGNLTQTAATLDIPLYTIREWRFTNWWAELVSDMRTEGSFTLSNKLKQAAEKALEVSMDRLENGNWVFDQKNGQLLRKPVNLQDAVNMTNSFLDRQQQLEKRPVEEANNQKVQDRLVALAEAFARFAGGKIVEDSGTPHEAIEVQGREKPEGDGYSSAEQDGTPEGGHLDSTRSGEELHDSSRTG